MWYIEASFIILNSIYISNNAFEFVLSLDNVKETNTTEEFGGLPSGGGCV